MNSNQPLVTICIPTYNAEVTLEETLNSILNQSYSNLIIKVFDNCSTDKTAQIVQDKISQHPNLHLIVNKENLGGEGNFTKCLQSGEGKYTAIFHADDIYDEHFIKMVVDCLEDNPDLVAMAAHARTINMQKSITGERFIPYELRSNSLSKLNYESLLKLTLKYGNFITCPAVIAKTDIYKEQIKVWNGTDFKTSADLDVWIRLSQIGLFGFLNKPLMNYRVAEASYSYNLKKVRTHRHDIFSVLDHYLKERNSNDYDFLELKDNALRSYNLMKLKEPDIIAFNPWRLKYLKIGLDDFFHLRLYLSILMIWALSLIFRILRRA